MAAVAATASTITSEQNEVVVKSSDDSSSSNELEDEESHETSLSLLLDFPPSDEMGFFQGQIGNFLHTFFSFSFLLSLLVQSHAY